MPRFFTLNPEVVKAASAHMQAGDEYRMVVATPGGEQEMKGIVTKIERLDGDRFEITVK